MITIRYQIKGESQQNEILFQMNNLAALWKFYFSLFLLEVHQNGAKGSVNHNLFFLKDDPKFAFDRIIHSDISIMFILLITDDRFYVHVLPLHYLNSFHICLRSYCMQHTATARNIDKYRMYEHSI